MNIQLMRKVVFAMAMGVITTGIISFALLAMNLGFSGKFVFTWLRSWALGYVLVIPAILLLGPPLQERIDRLIR